MARVPRCPECKRPMEFDDHERDWHCPECDADTLDELTADPEGFGRYDYDEEDRP